MSKGTTEILVTRIREAIGRGFDFSEDELAEKDADRAEAILQEVCRVVTTKTTLRILLNLYLG